MMISQHCPLGYCLSDRKVLDLTSNPDTQCNSNHTSTLRGGCKNHFSLAIGSSQRIQCSSNSYMSLFLFFIAGTLLIIFILALNLIVTQGLINGLISMQTFLWTYTCRHSFSLRERQMTSVFQIFIAWLNLDFDWGLFCCWSDCLLENMASHQFLFPLHIWLIAGVIIIKFSCRYSSRLTNLSCSSLSYTLLVIHKASCIYYSNCNKNWNLECLQFILVQDLLIRILLCGILMATFPTVITHACTH